jgi:hypothetical protein
MTRFYYKYISIYLIMCILRYITWQNITDLLKFLINFVQH